MDLENSMITSFISRQKYLPSYFDYEPFRIPPNLAQSLKHYECTRFGSDDFSSEPCPCCRQLEKIPMSMSEPLSHMETISQSACYYFQYLINMIKLALGIFLINGIYNLVQLVLYCHNNSDTCVYIYGVPFRKFNTYFDSTHQILDLATVVILFLFHLINSYKFRRLHFFERYRVKASDYTIMLSCVDHNLVSAQDLINFFRSQGTPIVQILYTHQIRNYIDAERKKLTLKSKLEHNRNKKANSNTIERIESEIREAQDLMLPTINRFYFNQESDIRTDKVFISFEIAEIKQAFAKKYRKAAWKKILMNLFGCSANFEINGCKIWMEQSAEPNEILWENLEVSNKQRYLRILFGNIFCIVILVISFWLVLMLSREQLDAQDSDKYISYMCAVVIGVVNLIMSYMLKFMSEKEGRYTLTGKLTSLMTKSTVAFFFNTALIPFSMFFIFHSRKEQQGLILTILSIFIMSSLISPILLLINISECFKYIRRRRLLKQSPSAVETTQCRANEIFQKPQFDIEFKYSVVSKLILMMIFFAAIFPLGAGMAFVGLCINFYVNKYMMLKHSQILRVSYKISRRINSINGLLPAIYGVGIITNEYLVQAQVSQDNLLILLLSILLSILSLLYSSTVTKYLHKRWKKQRNLINHPTRTEAVENLGMIDFKHRNPTSCQEVKHKELGGSIHPQMNLQHKQSQQGSEYKAPPPAFHRADSAYAGPLDQLPPHEPQHEHKNSFIRSMSWYANNNPE